MQEVTRYSMAIYSYINIHMPIIYIYIYLFIYIHMNIHTYKHIFTNTNIYMFSPYAHAHAGTARSHRLLNRRWWKQLVEVSSCSKKKKNPSLHILQKSSWLSTQFLVMETIGGCKSYFCIRSKRSLYIPKKSLWYTIYILWVRERTHNPPDNQIWITTYELTTKIQRYSEWAHTTSSHYPANEPGTVIFWNHKFFES